MQTEKTNPNIAVEITPAPTTKADTSIHFVNEEKHELLAILQRIPPNYHLIQYIFDRAIITHILNNKIPEPQKEDWLFMHIVMSDVFRCCQSIMKQGYKEPLKIDFTEFEKEISLFVGLINNPCLVNMNEKIMDSFNSLKEHLIEVNSENDLIIAEYSELFLMKLIRFILKVLNS